MSGITNEPDYDVPVSGTITALNGVVELDPLQKDQQAINIFGTWAATLVFEASIDGSSWFAVGAYNIATNALVTSATANGTFILISAGFSKTRVRASAFTSGTVSVANEGTESIYAVYVIQPNASALNANVRNQDGLGVPLTSSPIDSHQALDVNVIAGGSGGTPVSDLLVGPGVEGEITVGITAVEVKVGSTRLADRKNVTVLPMDANVYWGYTSGVTTATGTLLFKQQMGMWGASDSAQIWVIADVANRKVRVTESA